MRCLYFQCKPTPWACNKWTSPRHQSIVSLLLSCSKKEELIQIHAQMIRTQLIKDTFMASRIIAILASPSSLPDMDYARRVFDQIRHPNSYTWNSMIRGYTQHGAPRGALLMYKLMLRRGFSPDSYTNSVVTRASAQLHALQTGEMVHGLIVKCGYDSDMFVMSGFVNFYVSFGKIDCGRDIFDEMPWRDVVSWTSMLSGYAQLNQWTEALLLFDQMKAEGVQPNKVTVMSLLSACGQWQALDRGRWVHSQIVEHHMEHDIDVGNSLLNMYAKCRSMIRAFDVFRNMPMKNTATWNALIGGLVQNGLYTEALSVFREMTCSDARPDEITIVSALSACAQLGDLQHGKLLHAYIGDHMIICDLVVRNSLINTYAKCGDLDKAEAIFLEMPERDVFSWTVMISGFVQGNRYMEALSLFEEMRLSYVEANEVTLVSLLSACSQLGALDQGRRIHACIEENKVRKDTCLENALVDMYAKCGCIENALKIFHGMPQKDTLSWNVVIGGLASHGLGREAVDLFNQMQITGTTKPDSVTLLAVLCACAHSGMVREGFSYFDSMTSLYGIIREVEHYGCMVDLLSRAGLIDEAIDFVKKMPVSPNSVMWGSLLAACHVHHKMGLGERIAQHMIKLAPENEGAHVLISNLYAEVGRWDDVRQVRTLMGSKGLEKPPGCSWIELNGVIHEFFVLHRSLHPNYMIYLVLDSLAQQMKQTVCESCTVP